MYVAARVEQLRNTGLGNTYGNTIPTLSHPGNNNISMDDNGKIHEITFLLLDFLCSFISFVIQLPG